MPSPESPANLITARSSAFRDFSTPVAGVAIRLIQSCLLARLAQSYPASLVRENRYRGHPPAVVVSHAGRPNTFYRTPPGRARFLPPVGPPHRLGEFPDGHQPEST